MTRGLDHIVHAVADLDAAAAFYRRCGFSVGARNRHPWGTHNHVVQLPGFFIEVLTIGEPEKLGEDGLSREFGRPNQQAIARGDGFSMLVLESTDSAADVTDFKTAKIAKAGPLPFSRQATLPDNSVATVGFELAFAQDTTAPDVLFATCKQTNPEAFWNIAFQQHANGATSVAGVVLVAPRPGDHADFLRSYTGVDAIETRAAGIALRTARGDIEVMEPAAFLDRTGVRVASDDGTSIAALRVAVGRLDHVDSILRTGGIAFHRQGASLAVPPPAAFGATLILEQPDIA
jgi:catechol 2,3-dioxygenase-like lactoylglutathione lyase family enzyme